MSTATSYSVASSPALFGRTELLATIKGLLAEPAIRLVTLTGPGGVGKTSLANEIARDRSDALVISLAPITDESLVMQAIASAMDVQAGDGSLRDVVVQQLALHPRLLVLDNIEQLPRIGQTVVDLLDAAPGLRVLATSRRRLHLSLEHEVPVPPLPTSEDDRSAPPGELRDLAAVRLFAQRARAANAAFTLTDGNVRAVAAICRRLDGLPLAIELAAARCRFLSVDALLARLEHRLDLLSGGPQDRPDRQRTMRDAIAWSYDLLTEPEQAFFRRVASFAGSFTVDAAEAVAGGGALPLIDALSDHGLVQTFPDGNGEPRLRMLETVREYGMEQLTRAGELDATRAAHAAHFRAFAAFAGPKLQDSSVEQLRWWNRLIADIANFRAALEWCEAAGELTAALDIAGSLDWFWSEYTLIDEGLHRLRHLLDVDRDSAPVPIRAQALSVISMLADIKGEVDETIRAGEAAIALWREAGRTDRLLRAQYDLSHAAFDQSEFARALAMSEASLQIAIEIGDIWFQAAAHVQIGMTLGASLLDLDRALTHYVQSIDIFRSFGEMNRINGAMCGLAFTHLQRGELSQAWTTYRSALEIELTHMTDHIYCASIFNGLAAISARMGDDVNAVKLLSAAARAKTETGVPARKPARLFFEQITDELRGRLTPAAFTSAWAHGQTLDFDAAIAFAQALPGPTDAESASRPLDRLSRRELEVVRLLVDGKSDQEIADELFISRRTASQHVSAILSKLGVPTRAAAAAVAARQGDI